MGKKSKNKSRNSDITAEPNASLPKIKRKEFEEELSKLQVELTRLQAWAVAEGARVIVVFEGRDTAGKGGVIARIMQRCSPRVFKHVALPAPSDREKSQIYIQRYMAHFPGRRRDHPVRSLLVQPGGRRARDGLLHRRTVRAVPEARACHRARGSSNNGIYPAEVFSGRQPGRAAAPFRGADQDPVKHWKLSPMDVESVRRWWDYTQAYQAMMAATDTAADALVHRARRRQAPRAAQPNQPHVETRSPTEGRGRPAEDPEGPTSSRRARGRLRAPISCRAGTEPDLRPIPRGTDSHPALQGAPAWSAGPGARRAAPLRSAAWLSKDLAAGLSVAAIGLPVGIAYAELAGVPAVIGIYSAIFPLVPYALFGSSRQLMVGPDAATCIMVAASLAPLAQATPRATSPSCRC